MNEPHCSEMQRGEGRMRQTIKEKKGLKEI
jgi:hypothetical protein